ncbi:MAG TPA: hypothetical protein VEK07_01875 [Polyangiaceae bacterium]|nr:hypothetical protein [Polyangiaceae bacterium]
MNKEVVKSHSEHKTHKGTGIAKVESLAPEGSWQRTALGIVVAAGGGLLATALLGVGPVAIAGTAGYLAYREMRKPGAEKSAEGN